MNSIKHIKNNTNFSKIFQIKNKKEESRTILNSFYEANINLIPKPEKDTKKEEDY